VRLATHNPGGRVRFGVTATAASAVLYSAVVLLGVKAASPSVLDLGGDGDQSVVLIRPHDSAATDRGQRLPQASPRSARHQSHVTGQAPSVGAGTRSTAPQPAGAPAEQPTPSAPAPSRPADTKTQSAAPTSQTPTAEKETPLVEVMPPQPVPGVTLPSVTVPSPPVQLPQTPALPAVPQLPVSNLPG